ncbi:uncharacterized protein BDZ99DRAFT_356535, partial [Mytilinidion resinicola]
GAPPKFTPPAKLPERIPRNSGTHYVNQDAHLEERYPFKPLFSALEKTKPDYDMKDVDIVADTGTFLTLLGFLDGQTEEDIRIELHLVENTLVLTSREQYTSVNIDPKRGSLRPYEHSFPKHCSEFPEKENGAHTHHRAVRYTLGGLNFIVKYQPHAFCEGGDYVTEGTSVGSNESAQAGTHSRNVSNGSASTTASLPSSKRIKAPCYAELTARFEGNKFKEEPIDTPYHFPRMYFGRIPTIIVGTYRDGSFSSIQAFDSKRMLSEWEVERQEDLRKLVRLLRDWRDATEQAGGKAVALCDAQFWPLKFEVYKMQSPRGVLEEAMVNKFWK